MQGQAGHNTRPHIKSPPTWAMDDHTTELGYDSQATLLGLNITK